jgi:hypothetical protein
LTSSTSRRIINPHKNQAMKAERIVLSFIFILLGLLVAGGGFYLYQLTKTIPDSKLNTVTVKSPTPTPDTSGDLLTVDSPNDESVVDNRIVTISGKTTPDATLIISTDTTDQVVKPTTTGTYTLTQTIETGTNLITIRAVFSDGLEKRVDRTVTYSTESF